MSQTYTVRQVADILGYSTNSIYTFIKEKRIKAVRVGRGRFRIPLTELDRLLLHKSGQTTTPLTVPTPQPQWNGSRGGIEEPADHTILDVLAAPRVSQTHFPSFFDWFIGMCAITLGASLFIFSPTFGEAIAAPYLVWKPVFQGTLIAAGIGLLLTDILEEKSKYWHSLFHILLILGLTGVAWWLYSMRDISGAFLFGGLVAVTILVSMVRLGAVGGFTLYIAFLTSVAGPATILLVPTDPHVAWAYGGFSGMHLLVVGLGLTGGLLLLWAYRRKRLVYFGLLLLTVIGLLALSLWFVLHSLWDHAFFMLLMALFCLLAPVWRSLPLQRPEVRRQAFMLLAAVLFLLLLAMGTVAVLQMNMFEYAQTDLAQKRDYGRLFVESVIEEGQIAVKGAAQNPLVVAAFTGKDEEALMGLGRTIFETNPYFSRVLFVAESGEVLSYYPLSGGQLTTSDIGFRDYFLQAVRDKKLVMSDVFETVNELRVKRVVLAAPVVNSQKSVVGVIVAGFSLETMGAKLQSIATELHGEYFVMVDRAGNYIVHPDQLRIGEPTDQSGPLAAGALGLGGVASGYTHEGQSALVAYGPIPQTGWAIGIYAPMTKVLRSTTTVIVAISTMTGVMTLLTVGFFLFQRNLARIEVPSGSLATSSTPDTS